MKEREEVALIASSRRRRRVVRRQLAPGAMAFDDYADLTAFGSSADNGNLTTATAWEDWQWATQ
jgi:hypothetical protein